MKWLLILGAAITLLNNAAPTAAKFKVVCYHGSWSAYRPGAGQFEIEYIDPFLCTHVIYTFVGIQSNGDIRILDSWNEIDKGGFRRFNELKNKNPSLKTLVAIGGWNEGSTPFSAVVNNPSLRASFVDNIVRFVGKYGFDGFDLDWEYPAQRGGAATDKEAFILLLKELRTKFDKQGYLLSAAVASAESSASISYNIAEVGKYVDFINVMSYDLHGSWESETGHNAPLFPGANDVTEEQKSVTVDAAIQYWIRQGAPLEKIILGIGTYGRTFTLSGTAECKIGAPASGAGNAGPYTSEAGILGYNEICEKQSTWSEHWDDRQKISFACKGNQFVGYDNVRSVIHKAEYVVQRQLGGAMIWSVETDDFLGRCGIKYPLLTVINQVLFGGIIIPETPKPQPTITTTTTTTTKAAATTKTTTKAAATTKTTTKAAATTKTTTKAAATTTTTTPASGGGVATNPTKAPGGGDSSDPSQLCNQEGYVRDPKECQVFYQCQGVAGKFIAHRFECAAGLQFDTSINVCNWASAVGC